MSTFILDCINKGKLGIPDWFLYISPMVKFLQVHVLYKLYGICQTKLTNPKLQVLNASINFPIYLFMGTSFKKAFKSMVGLD